MQAQFGQVSMAVVDTDNSNTGQQESQHETQIVVVVHRAQQHREYDRREDDAYSSRQDIDPPSMQTD
jgi:hypothetical protein